MDGPVEQTKRTAEEDQALRDAFAEVEAQIPIQEVLVHVVSHMLEGLDRTSLALLCSGIEVGIELAGCYPEWTQALFLRLNPTPESRERCKQGLKVLPELIPMRIEQAREV